MTKKELKAYIATLHPETPYHEFKSSVSVAILPMVRPIDWYHRWYGVFKEIARIKS